ncbi:MAG: energy transducer TonB [Terrimicrobiaceae bacterium]
MPAIKPAAAKPRATPPGGAVTLAKPDVARNPPPKYPEFARRNGWQGHVMVRASVDASGRVRYVTVARASGYAVLDQAALQAVRGWRERWCCG